MITEDRVSIFNPTDQFIFTHRIECNNFRTVVQHAPLNGKRVFNEIRNNNFCPAHRLRLSYCKPIMNDLVESKDPKNSQFSEKGLYVNDDDQDWGSAGMNNIQEDSEYNQ